jgi:hypothetical protein
MMNDNWDPSPDQSRSKPQATVIYNNCPLDNACALEQFPFCFLSCRSSAMVWVARLVANQSHRRIPRHDPVHRLALLSANSAAYHVCETRLGKDAATLAAPSIAKAVTSIIINTPTERSVRRAQTALAAARTIPLAARTRDCVQKPQPAELARAAAEDRASVVGRARGRATADR